ncbi:MAG: DUF2905 domain-containing protein [Candidatus Omnitrophica bacterium]|nr:DUF2905 domain-containing protein [Candidatus Omnitrophota bacterium]
MGSIGRLLIVTGIVLVVLGAILTLGGKLSWFGRLPGDIYIQRKGFSFYFPITTSIIISIALSLIALLIRRR